MRVVRPWPRLSREAVSAPSLAVFKARLGGALSTLGWWKMSLLMAGGLEPDDLSGPFQLKPFYDSVILWFCIICSFIIIETNIHQKFSVLFSKSHDILPSFCLVLLQIKCFCFVYVSHLFISLHFSVLNRLSTCTRHLSIWITFQAHEQCNISQQSHDSAFSVCSALAPQPHTWHWRWVQWTFQPQRPTAPGRSSCIQRGRKVWRTTPFKHTLEFLKPFHEHGWPYSGVLQESSPLAEEERENKLFQNSCCCVFRTYSCRGHRITLRWM